MCVCVCVCTEIGCSCRVEVVRVRERRQSDGGVCVSASETEGRYIWAAAVMKGRWTMTRPSYQSLPPPPFLPLSQSTSLSRWHFGKSHCHTTFNKDKSLGRAAGDDWPDGAAEYPSHKLFHSRSCVFSTGRGRRCGCKKPRQGTQTSVCIYARRWHKRTSTHGRISRAGVCAFSFSFSLDTLFIHIQHLP